LKALAACDKVKAPANGNSSSSEENRSDRFVTFIASKPDGATADDVIKQFAEPGSKVTRSGRLLFT
jgi:hypothetical protein